MISGLLLAVFVVLMIALARSFTTLIHELGHAIPSLLFTKGDVLVFIGSYNTREKFMPLKLGRLKIYFRLNFLGWRAGLCQHQLAHNFWRELLITIGGPIASVILSLTMLILCLMYRSSDTAVILASTYCLLAIYDFAINLYPSTFRAPQITEQVMQSDGYQLMKLLQFGKNYYEVQNAWSQFEKGRIEQSIEHLIKLSPSSRIIKFELVHMYIKSGKFQDAFELCKALFQDKEPTTDQLELLGDIYSGLGQHEDAIKYYSTYLFHNYDNFQVKNKKARLLFKLGEEPASLKLYFHSLAQAPVGNVEALQYIGRIYTLLEQYEKAFEYLQSALKQGKHNSKTYLFLAKYYEKKGMMKDAIENYQIAKDLGSDFHGLDFKIETL